MRSKQGIAARMDISNTTQDYPGLKDGEISTGVSPPLSKPTLSCSLLASTIQQACPQQGRSCLYANLAACSHHVLRIGSYACACVVTLLALDSSLHLLVNAYKAEEERPTSRLDCITFSADVLRLEPHTKRVPHWSLSCTSSNCRILL